MTASVSPRQSLGGGSGITPMLVPAGKPANARCSVHLTSASSISDISGCTAISSNPILRLLSPRHPSGQPAPKNDSMSPIPRPDVEDPQFPVLSPQLLRRYTGHRRGPIYAPTPLAPRRRGAIGDVHVQLGGMIGLAHRRIPTQGHGLVIPDEVVCELARLHVRRVDRKATARTIGDPTQPAASGDVFDRRSPGASVVPES